MSSYYEQVKMLISEEIKGTKARSLTHLSRNLRIKTRKRQQNVLLWCFLSVWPSVTQNTLCFVFNLVKSSSVNFLTEEVVSSCFYIKQFLTWLISEGEISFWFYIGFLKNRMIAPCTVKSIAGGIRSRCKENI